MITDIAAYSLAIVLAIPAREIFQNTPFFFKKQMEMRGSNNKNRVNVWRYNSARTQNLKITSYASARVPLLQWGVEDVYEKVNLKNK
jgi:hypothetical protein